MGNRSSRPDAKISPAPLESQVQARLQARTALTLPSGLILGDDHEVRICHNGEFYRLLRTRNDKLILVK